LSGSGTGSRSGRGSSGRGAATDASAARCISDRRALEAAVEGLGSADAGLAGDCAEVMTKVAMMDPALVAPYAGLLARLLGHGSGRVRWESMHAFALVAGLVPDEAAGRLDWLDGLIRSDWSVIVRDYALDAVSAYGASGPDAAERALPVLMGGSRCGEAGTPQGPSRAWSAWPPPCLRWPRR